jgi:uncharacterized Ntn-hydrolase superfamily protein
MLTGRQVLEQTSAAFLENARLPLAQRLIASMQAGEEAGGDIRGGQSTALVISRRRMVVA